MLDVMTSLRMLEQRTEDAVHAQPSPDAAVGLGVEARNLGAILGTTPDLASGGIRDRALLLTHHGEELARAALTGQAERLAGILRELEADTHELRGALEAADRDRTKG
ncbi:MAG TPA: hypothetical protein VI997_10260 [Candidatus Thermoplasmatota archaeon]|nr:hypothetical protein [Candidatus Thermoplasmatota archaeon]